MRNVVCFIVLILCFIPQLAAQDLAVRLFDEYEAFAEDGITSRRIKHRDVQRLLEEVAASGVAEVNTVGASIEGRELYLISLGTGDTDVFLWSQMHGDESTATMAIFDMLNFFASTIDYPERAEILKGVRIHFLPMLNPDGAEHFTRRNRLGIDMNRDALRLQSPEARTLKRVRDSLDADFGFNLHDQSRYYNALRTEKPATISFLAPAYNYEKSVNTVRANAMKVIVLMNRVLQQFVPGQVGRYNDDFEPRAFGDNIQKWGTSTMLIESGGQYKDPEKQEIRKLNFVAIIAALHSIAKQTYAAIPAGEYFDIPNNDRKLFDLKITGLTYELLGHQYILDVGFFRNEVDNEAHEDYHIVGGIGDLGDLSTFYGYKMLNASGFTFVPAKIFPEVVKDVKGAMAMDHVKLIQQGYGYVRVEEIPDSLMAIDAPLHLIATSYTPDPGIFPGNNPSFFLEDSNGDLRYYVVNGCLIDLRINLDPEPHGISGLILR